MALRIIFMGTPQFAVASLDKLVQEGFQVVAVVTAPDKPAGRGMKLSQSAVKEYAVARGIPVLQPPKLKDRQFIEELKSFEADVQVVVAFRMLPEIVWNMPPLGTINLHASLLPQYRGAAPINWAIIQGEKETGITTFKLQHEIDTGNILLQEALPISEHETAGSLHDKLMIAGADLLAETIHQLEKGCLKEIAQKELKTGEPLRHAPKIFTETCQINWNDSTENVYNLIRGLSPYPAAYTFLDGKKLKIFSGLQEDQMQNAEPGKMETDGKTYLRFATADGAISVTELQLEGKRKMTVTEFLRGYRP